MGVVIRLAYMVKERECVCIWERERDEVVVRLKREQVP